MEEEEYVHVGFSWRVDNNVCTCEEVLQLYLFLLWFNSCSRTHEVSNSRCQTCAYLYTQQSVLISTYAKISHGFKDRRIGLTPTNLLSFFAWSMENSSREENSTDEIDWLMINREAVRLCLDRRCRNGHRCRCFCTCGWWTGRLLSRAFKTQIINQQQRCFSGLFPAEREKLTFHFACKKAYQMWATVARNQSGRSMNDMTWVVPASFLNRSFFFPWSRRNFLSERERQKTKTKTKKLTRNPNYVGR